ncbi:CCA tRNA nucleotidyltransferase [Paenibacillus albiflavus]|uniref:CCA tRNA nucleotidyltransferase n=1 Tax=Paenibacillus albiflavus TaxID=2545760 RepID=A0A4R4ERK8_9BACL|nr:CCA tRNA nucleotidyltransferase [Paenibacillus albiflavus]TCZ81185.1 CCA tRNA nucleotidyltransferase [Paenibacillus albiflavus]
MTRSPLSENEYQAKAVLKQLIAHGYDAYFVGGCVRDTLLNRAVHDYDIATNATPEEIMACFERTVPTGIKHGTVTVLMDRHPYEVTTFRTETEYEDYRRPKEVKYVTSLLEDLRRRDFTMNAMAMDIAGNLIDPFGGRTDLGQGILRCVGTAEERFGEDALRMLRCVRFAANYGLHVEEATWAALRVQAPLLSHIAMERVRAELERLVGGADPHRGIRMLVDSELPNYFRQQLEVPLERWRSAFAERALRELATLEDAAARWVLLLLLLEEDPAHIAAALRKLTFSRAAWSAIVSALELHSSMSESVMHPPAADSAVRSLETTFKLATLAQGKDAATLWLSVIRVLSNAVQGDDDASSGSGSDPNNPFQLESFLRGVSLDMIAFGTEWLDAMTCTNIRELAITGSELIEANGKPGGPWVAILLHRLLQEVALGALPNDKAALLEASSNE